MDGGREQIQAEHRPATEPPRRDRAQVALAGVVLLLVLALTQLLLAVTPVEALPFPWNARSAPSPPSSSLAAGALQEVSPPEAVQQLQAALAERQPVVEILSPQDGSVLPAGPWTLRLKLRDWPLVDDARLGLGPHLVVQLDQQPPLRWTAVEGELPELSPGSHRLTVYAALPWGEARKNPGAVQQIRLHRTAPNPLALPERGSPQLLAVSPPAIAGEEPLLLDWLLLDAPLQDVGAGTQWRLRAEINEQVILLDQQTPLWLSGWGNGVNALRLTLLDGRGTPLNPPFNALVQEVDRSAAGPPPRWQGPQLSAQELAILIGLHNPLDDTGGGSAPAHTSNASGGNPEPAREMGPASLPAPSWRSSDSAGDSRTPHQSPPLGRASAQGSGSPEDASPPALTALPSSMPAPGEPDQAGPSSAGALPQPTPWTEQPGQQQAGAEDNAQRVRSVHTTADSELQALAPKPPATSSTPTAPPPPPRAAMAPWSDPEDGDRPRMDADAASGELRAVTPQAAEPQAWQLSSGGRPLSPSDPGERMEAPVAVGDGNGEPDAPVSGPADAQSGRLRPSVANEDLPHREQGSLAGEAPLGKPANPQAGAPRSAAGVPDPSAEGADTAPSDEAARSPRVAPSSSLGGRARDLVNADGTLRRTPANGPLQALMERLQP